MPGGTPDRGAHSIRAMSYMAMLIIADTVGRSQGLPLTHIGLHFLSGLIQHPLAAKQSNSKQPG